ncbi:MAG: heterodisulfide reductase-related iron-sulfur binding cluster [Oscillospiraceae bacterium]
MDKFEERSTRIYRQKQMFDKHELEERESLCVHEQPAFCTAACPMKLDARALTAAVAEGKLAEARAMLERVAPFPLILAEGCEAPCESACRLCEKGEGIAIGAIERAVMALSVPKTGRGLLKFKKKKTVAVFGGSLFALALAGELAVKSYPASFFFAEADAEALLRNCAPFLTDAQSKAEAARLAAMDITLVPGSEISPALLDARRGEFDVCCLSEPLSALSEDAPDPVTLVRGDGCVCRPASDGRVLTALFDARRAAVSVDRLAQSTDPALMRGEEGPVPSRLYTNMQSVPASRRVPEGDGYTERELRDEAARCIQCRCEECLKACAYLRHYKKFPRVLTREIYNNVSIIMGDHMMNRPINSCALCGQCAVVCPNGYDMGEICHIARENMVSTGKMPLAPHEFALYDMLFSNNEAFLSRPQPGFEHCRYVFFPGCQAGASAPLTVARAYEDLTRRLDGGVALMLGCCGAIAQWAGRYELYDETAQRLRAELEALGSPTVIVGCPTCEKTLRESVGGEVLGIWDILNDLGLPEGAKSPLKSAVMRDSCGARGDKATRDSVRALAGKLGIDLRESALTGDETPCCGYGGLVMYANREVAREMAQSCLERDEGPYVTYCMACRDRLAREGRETAHILELVYGSPAGAPADISGRRANRLKLKNRLLRDIWGENAMEKNLDFKLEFTESARAMMDERMILDTDVLAVLVDFRKNGEAVLDNETGLLLARLRDGNVTFWVRFEEIDGGYIVHRAYSHRMTVK